MKAFILTLIAISTLAAAPAFAGPGDDKAAPKTGDTSSSVPCPAQGTRSDAGTATAVSSGGGNPASTSGTATEVKTPVKTGP